MSDYTPTLREAREIWAMPTVPGDFHYDEAVAQFERFMAAQRAEIYREAARFLRSNDNPRSRDQGMARICYTMDDAGYELIQQSKHLEASEVHDG